MRHKKGGETKTESKQKKEMAASVFFPLPCSSIFAWECRFKLWEKKEPELSRGFVINTHRRQFWQAQIPYLSRRTLGKGLLSWCTGCTSESWSSPFSVLSGNRQSSPHIHLKREADLTSKIFTVKSFFFTNFLPCTQKHGKPILSKHMRSYDVPAMIKKLSLFYLELCRITGKKKHVVGLGLVVCFMLSLNVGLWPR